MIKKICLVTRRGKKVMGRKVVVTSVFETDIENIWCKIQDIETLREICKPKASFISYGNIPPVWKEGETFYFRFLSVRLNRLKNKLLANYLRNRGNDLATVRNSAFCVAILSNNSFICKYNIFFRKYELSVAIL